jgi:hypothetical protein
MSIHPVCSRDDATIAALLSLLNRPALSTPTNGCRLYETKRGVIVKSVPQAAFQMLVIAL